LARSDVWAIDSEVAPPFRTAKRRSLCRFAGGYAAGGGTTTKTRSPSAACSCWRAPADALLIAASFGEE
jgi:hypothetical protein